MKDHVRATWGPRDISLAKDFCLTIAIWCDKSIYSVGIQSTRSNIARILWRLVSLFSDRHWKLSIQNIYRIWWHSTISREPTTVFVLEIGLSIGRKYYCHSEYIIIFFQFWLLSNGISLHIKDCRLRSWSKWNSIQILLTSDMSIRDL